MNKTTSTTPLVLVMVVFLILALSSSTCAQGGPPMITDDPATPGKGMWEVNFLTTMVHSRGGWTFETPIVDVNYGLGNHIQLKIEAPWVVSKETEGRAKTGLGNSMVGLKWRFLDEERSGFDMSIYPQLELNNPTNSMARGLVDEGPRLFLPVEVAKKVGPVEVTGELGYSITRHGPDEWEFGILFARSVTRRVELMGELHGSALRTVRENELVFNAGSRIQLGRNAILLISAGRTIHNAGGQGPQTFAAFGIQFNLKNEMPAFARNK
jgi:hypothetical protein